MEANALPTGDDAAQRLIDLNSCIEFLEKTGDLVHVSTEVDPDYELAGIAKKLEGGKCVLFERVRGSEHAVFIGLLWNRDIVGRLFGAPGQRVPFVIADAIGQWKRNKEAIPSPIVDNGPANEIIEPEIDLFKLPVPIHALEDGGKYFDSSVVMVKNPQTGVPNISIHRIMISEKDRLTFLIDPGRHLGAYLAIAEAQGRPLEVTINNGVGLAPWLASVIAKQGDGKQGIANHLAGRPIPLIKAQTVDVPAFSSAQFVIEAEILPGVREEEGPFAEVTGYYAERARRWVMRVKKITRRRNPIFHTLLSGTEVWNAVGFTAEAKIFSEVKGKVPQLRAVYLSPGGCGFYGAVVQVEKDSEDAGKEAIMAAFEAFEPLQRVVAVDTDVNIFDPIDVDWAVTTRFDADNDLIILKNQPGHILNPMVRIDPGGKGGTVTKTGIDATTPYPRTSQFKRVKFKEVDLGRYKIGQ